MTSERETFARTEDASRQRNAQIAEHMADLEGRLRPLERDHAGFERETNRLEQDAIQLQKRIAQLEVKLGSAEGEDRQRMAMELAGLKARREQIERDAPELEGRCSAIEPAIESLRADLEAAREEANANRRDLAAQDQRTRETVRDLEGQLANQRRELDRIAYDRTMTERALGDDLDQDRVHHSALVGPYRLVDELGGTLTALEMRIVELEKEGAGLDRAAVRRSLIVLGAAFVLVIALVILLIVR